MLSEGHILTARDPPSRDPSCITYQEVREPSAAFSHRQQRQKRRCPERKRVTNGGRCWCVGVLSTVDGGADQARRSRRTSAGVDVSARWPRRPLRGGYANPRRLRPARPAGDEEDRPRAARLGRLPRIADRYYYHLSDQGNANAESHFLKGKGSAVTTVGGGGQDSSRRTNELRTGYGIGIGTQRRTEWWNKVPGEGPGEHDNKHGWHPIIERAGVAEDKEVVM